MKNANIRKNKKPAFLVLCAVVLIAVVFSTLTDLENHGKSKNSNADRFSGIYHAWRKEFTPHKIEIEKTDDHYFVNMHMSDEIVNYRGHRVGDEIVISVSREKEIHLYKNDAELRLYKVLSEGHLPEDIELSFFEEMKK